MLKNLVESLQKFPGRNAFCIADKYYTYSEFAGFVSNIRNFIDANLSKDETAVGITAFDDIETYSSIFGAMFAGVAFVPIDPRNPVDRNKAIAEIAGVKTIFTSRFDDNVNSIKDLPGIKLVDSKNIPSSPINLSLPDVKPESTAYILFTSGSTGVPKGVPLSLKNITSFIDAFYDLGYKIDENDRCLQSSDLTFDLSTMSYMIPLSKGACVYTVPSGGIKYAAIYSVLEDYQITMALMVPSVLNYLRPFFRDIKLEKMRYSMFCGEALYEDVLAEWSECVPNALIQNVYGPTEATNFCMTYDWNRDLSRNKSVNGVVCIGRPMKDMESIIVNDDNLPVAAGEKGELCLAGPQLTDGYIKNPEKNKAAFFTLKRGEEDVRYYKTGDLAYVDDEGDFMFCGRIDYQIKIHGYRIELGEIEHYVRQFIYPNNAAAVTYRNSMGITQIHVFLEDYLGSTNDLAEYLKTKLPQYMMPAVITTMKSFPLNANGKIDRKALLKSAAEIKEN